ncbi:hybrid sensor histidine kinase/response regulator [Nitrospirillum pindoramense]|uniref:histidine kinase n=1 Tax=Nitrospirillum amazonense TaxID=28077 RepID=A0A560H417_9PROT|nr:PAS domain-containing sensor histidine kinase [Nitrospirillum amazonense]TWB41037.1 PAS domain S-box-containing protein [Nitrospirillum amazonense]
MSTQDPVHGDLVGAEQRFQLLVDGISDYAIYMLDPNGFVSSWNARAGRFKGYETNEILGQHVSLFYTEDDRKAGVPERALAIAGADGRFEAEGWRVRKDGTRFWASVVIEAVRDAAGVLVGFAKITRDISERRLAQQALHDSEQRFRLLVQGVTDYAIYMLDPTGHVTNWNTGAQRIKGYSREEIIGEHFSRFYTEEDRADNLPGRALAIAEAEGRFEREGWRVRKDGSRFWAHVIIDPIRDPAGKLIGFAKITRDITERREWEERLRHSQKMEAIGQLTGGLAHDFNNLLQAISGCLEMLARNPVDPARRHRLLEGGLQAVDRGRTLIHQLMTFSRQRPMDLEAVDLRDVLPGCLGLIRQVVRGDIEVKATLPADLWPVETDPVQLEVALLNLAANARDAMPNGGTLTLGARNVPDAGRRGDMVEIEVGDTGMGMAPDVASRAFDPFFTTKPLGKGTGLGLSQVYGFARQSGGEARLSSRPGRGTTVSLSLPRTARVPQRLFGAARTEPQGGSARILMAEDDAVLGPVITTALEELGYCVTHVGSGQEALDLMDRGGAYDLVFSDIVMPGAVNGLNLAREIRRRHPDMPVILSTGYSEEPAVQQGFPVLAKPYRIEDLTRAIKEALGHPAQP